MTVRVVVTWSRSGGTMLTRCLGALPDTVVLSEVSPFRGDHSGVAGPQTPRKQAKEWYGIDVSSDEFAESIGQIDQVCKDKGLHLVVGLWCVGEFANSRQLGTCPPNRLVGYELLRNNYPDLRAIGWIRDPIDIWVSQGANAAEYFFSNYLRYLTHVCESGIPLVKYEDFCAEPDQTFMYVCDCLGLVYSDSFKRFGENQNVLGDKLVTSSRGFSLDRIACLARRQIPTMKIRQLHACGAMRSANEMVGYATKFNDVKMEPLRTRARLELSYWFRYLANVKSRWSEGKRSGDG